MSTNNVHETKSEIQSLESNQPKQQTNQQPKQRRSAPNPVEQIQSTEQIKSPNQQRKQSKYNGGVRDKRKYSKEGRQQMKQEGQAPEVKRNKQIKQLQKQKQRQIVLERRKERKERTRLNKVPRIKLGGIANAYMIMVDYTGKKVMLFSEPQHQLQFPGGIRNCLKCNKSIYLNDNCPKFYHENAMMCVSRNVREQIKFDIDYMINERRAFYTNPDTIIFVTQWTNVVGSNCEWYDIENILKQDIDETIETVFTKFIKHVNSCIDDIQRENQNNGSNTYVKK